MKRVFSLIGLLVLLLTLVPASVAAAPPDPVIQNPWVAKQIAQWEDCVDVALGKMPADLAVRAGKLFDSNTGTWLEDQTIAVKGNYICWVGPTAEWKHEAKQAIDYSAYTLGPVFGESHTHLESARETPDQAARFQTLYGQGWVLEASHEAANVWPVEKMVAYFLKCWDLGCPFNIYPDLASAAPPTPFEFTGAGDSYNYDSFMKLFQSDPRVRDIDEVMNGPVWKNRNFPGHKVLLGLLAAAFSTGNPIEGHMSLYTSFDDISAAGDMHLSSDHENARGTDQVSLGEEAWRKLTHGVTLILRTADADQIIPYLIQKGLKDWSKVTLTTDDRAPDETLNPAIGGTVDNVRRAVKAGATVEVAWQMASINPARYSDVAELEGSDSPGKFASFLVLQGDPKDFNIKHVWVNGVHAVEDGKFIATIPAADWSEYTGTMNTGKLTVDDFAIKVDNSAVTATVAVLQPFYFAPDYMTTVLPVKDGKVQSDHKAGYVKLSMIDRYHGTPNVASMIWTGVGPDEDGAAFCETESHDNHYLQCLSTSDEAALLATNRLNQIGGGYIFVKDGEVVAEVALEVGGLMTATPAAQTAVNFQNFWKKLGAYTWLGKLVSELRQRFATLTCDPWKWVLVTPFAGCKSGFVNVTTGQCHAVAW